MPVITESKPSTNPIVFLDLKFGCTKGGRVIIELFTDIVPKTAENFRALCTGENGVGKCGKPLHYKGTKFYRVVPLFMAQGGNVTMEDGTSGESIYGEKFEDENFKISHDKGGIVGMANNGPNSNSSHFYITTVPCTHLDGINVAFGRVLKGFNIIVEMADRPRIGDRPVEDIVIYDCGELKANEPWHIEEADGTKDIYPPWPDDWDIEFHSNYGTIEEAIINIKESGNYYYNSKHFTDSERKYVKTLRYIDWYLSQYNHCDKDKLNSLRNNSMMNLAAVKLKKGKNKEVIELCTQVLRFDPTNVKAYYRRAQATLALKEYDKALEDLNLALVLLPNDKNIQSVLRVAKKDKLSYLKREKITFSRIFN